MFEYCSGASEHSRRGDWRILHVNVTDYRPAAWTIQRFRQFLAFDHPYRFAIHKRDDIRARSEPPLQTAHACERVIGTIRRECLDFIIPINGRQLRSTVREFVAYYNRDRPHASLGPGVPEPNLASAPVAVHRHKLRVGYGISSKSILGGWHHDYRLEKEAA